MTIETKEDRSIKQSKWRLEISITPFLFFNGDLKNPCLATTISYVIHKNHRLRKDIVKEIKQVFK